MKKKLFLAAILLFVGLFLIACNGTPKEVNVPKGTFYSLQEAYDGGFITRGDIKHISYFATGRVVEVLDATGNEWEMELHQPENYWTKIRKIDFTPQTPNPFLTNISPKVISDMKSAFYAANKELMDISLQQEIERGDIRRGTTALDTISIDAFYGEYNGSYAVRITSSLWGYGDLAIHQLASNIGWDFGVGPYITIFKMDSIAPQRSEK
ncbi:MAG: hypothetical protein FWC97_03040 [Treponema sp.]|nr:hypothetical protein [Treponema sp.]